jgi:hypothetical protein
LIKNNHFGCLSAKPYFENWFGGSMYYDLNSLQSATGKFQCTTQGIGRSSRRRRRRIISAAQFRRARSISVPTPWRIVNWHLGPIDLQQFIMPRCAGYSALAQAANNSASDRNDVFQRFLFQADSFARCHPDD